ncbi:effector from type III secretion system family protein [Chlamydia ibidis]|uniref:Effector from type III secretion system family protein n=2 Tax=Chlamydia ibidis TaxID=1405396 RepID=S7KE00_9CHLA|nr:CT620/CT621 family type III secretion system effector [Chlamydia ibidis]EPP34431.1 effector from type III secretion system family protein [Chlamydia ibidis]EQM63204.1 hypothetical protein H359_0079 [Chlamydia ibidis 10-1398/6]
MSSFHIQNRSRTISGESLFNIKLDHKFSNFDHKAQPAIDIEELNSGLYALKRLSSVLEAAGLHSTKLLNPKNTVFPSPKVSPKAPSESEAPVTTVEAPQDTNAQISSIQATCAKNLVNIVLSGLATLIADVPELKIAQIPSVILALALIENLVGHESLDTTQQATVFSGCYDPTYEEIIDKIVKQYADTIEQGQLDLANKLMKQGVTSEELSEAQQAYKDQFVNDFFKKHVEGPLNTYRASVGEQIGSMLTDMLKIAPTISTDVTSTNVATVNGQNTLKAVLSGLEQAITKVPSVGGEKSVVITVTSLTPMLSKTSLENGDLTKIYEKTDDPDKASLDRHLKPHQAAVYREGITTAYQTAVQNLDKVRLSIDDQKKNLENQITMFQQAQLCCDDWMGKAPRFDQEKAYTSAKLGLSMETYAGLMNLSEMYYLLQPEEKSIFDTYVDQYKKLTMSLNFGTNDTYNTVTVSQLVAIVGTYQINSEYCLQNAVQNLAKIQENLTTRANTIQQLHFFDDIGPTMVQIGGTQNLGANFLRKNASNDYVPNFAYFNQYGLRFHHVHPDFATQAQTIQKNFDAACVQHITQLKQKIAELEKTYESLDPATASFVKDREKTVKAWLNSESLGGSLIYLILNSQLPKQKIFLEPLIQEINFNNLAANAINELLKITNEFATTSVYYNLSSYLIQSKEGDNLFSGDYFETYQALIKEREYIARDINRCKRAQLLVVELLKKISASQQVSAAQKSQMLNATANYNFIITSTLNQLIVLDSLLVNLKLSPKTVEKTQKSGNAKAQEYDPNVFMIVCENPEPTLRTSTSSSNPENKSTRDHNTDVTAMNKDWVPCLAALEGFISTGFPTASPSGGLGPLFTQIQSDQQDYTTQSQTQQLNLQNQMTNVQQEWTLVSTSMQVLNQILSKLAGEIYTN